MNKKFIVNNQLNRDIFFEGKEDTSFLKCINVMKIKYDNHYVSEN